MESKRVHRASLLVLVVVGLLAIGTVLITRSVRDTNEHQLLRLQADQIGQLVQSLATSQQSSVELAATVASSSDGDGDFERIMGPLSKAQTWAVLHFDHGALRIGTVLGGSTADLGLADLQKDKSAIARLGRAFQGEFVVLGITGSGLQRRLAMAAGPPGGDGIVAYTSIPMLSTISAPGSSELLGGIDLALYVGSSEDAAGLVLATTPELPLAGRHEVRTVEIGHMPVTYAVASKAPLSGPLASQLPLILGLGILFSGLVVAWVIELNLRKRDRALELVAARDAAHAERSKLEAELRRSQRLDAVGQLAGGIAHDFNNLLAAIMSYADLVADDLGDHPARADVEEIRSAARRGAGLTRQLLQFSRTDPARAEVVDLNAVVGELERMLTRTIGEDITVRSELDADDPAVAVDSSELEQVVMNLIVNARDALRDTGGTISVATRVVDVPAHDAGVAGLPAGTYARLTVTDDGCGMSTDTAARAFEPFFTTKGRGQGTGLGLSTVYGIIQRAGGAVAVRTSEGEGTEIAVYLPLAGAAPTTTPAAGAPRAADAEHGAGRTVLLVEDEHAVRRAVTRMLQHAGYAVIEAPDGPTALEYTGPIDVLLTDVIMPGGLTGKDVADAMRDRLPGLPVVYMSGYSADILARNGVQDGRSSVLAKPFTETELLSSISRALDGAKEPVR